MAEEISTYEGEGVNQVGSPEHINQMLAAVDAPVETFDEGLVQNGRAITTEGRPLWLPEKFQSPEEMARAYSELETKFHSANEQVQQIEDQAILAQQSENIQSTSVPQVQELLDSKGLDLQIFQKEYNETGQLSEDAYGALQEAGIEKGVVDTWIQGQEALVNQNIDELYKTAGGEQEYNQMLEWANDNLQPWEVDAYNAQIANLDPNAMFTVSNMMARYKNAEGSPPVLMTGEPTPSHAPRFESLAQLTTAMSDPRYAEDPAFRADVTTRLKNSTIL